MRFKYRRRFGNAHLMSKIKMSKRKSLNLKKIINDLVASLSLKLLFSMVTSYS